MIEGINILNQTEIMTEPSWLLGAIIVGVVILIVGIGLLSHFTADCFSVGATLGVLLSFLYITITVGCFNNTKPTGRYQYEVTIDKSVNFTELYEKYDVVEQRGEIYVLEDKEQ